MCLFCQPGYRLIIDCVSADRRSEPSPPIGLFRAFIGPSTLHPTSISFGLCEPLLYGLTCLILPWQPCCFFCLTKPRGDDAWVLRTSTNMQTAKARRTPKLRSPALCCLVPFFLRLTLLWTFLNMVEGITSNMTKIPERALVCCRFALPKKNQKKKTTVPRTCHGCQALHAPLPRNLVLSGCTTCLIGCIGTTAHVASSVVGY